MVHSLAARVCRASAVAVLALGLSVAGAVAETGAGSVAPRAVSVQMANGVTFNWLAKKGGKAGITNAVLVGSQNAKPQKARFFGKGSYICSPAGFGKKSRCFAR